MALHQQPLQPSKEGRLSLAVLSFKRDPSQSKRSLAATYDVPESTLQTRLRGILPKRKTTSVNQKLLPVKGQSLIQ